MNGSNAQEVKPSRCRITQEIFERTLGDEGIESADQRMMKIDAHVEVAIRKIIDIDHKISMSTVMLFIAIAGVVAAAYPVAVTFGIAVFINFYIFGIVFSVMGYFFGNMLLEMKKDDLKREIRIITNGKAELRRLCNEHAGVERVKKTASIGEVFEAATNVNVNPDLGVLSIMKDYL